LRANRFTAESRQLNSPPRSSGNQGGHPTLLYSGYSRLTQLPLNLQADELLSAVVERLLNLR
jgi:hypothetical protein